MKKRQKKNQQESKKQEVNNTPNQESQTQSKSIEEPVPQQPQPKDSESPSIKETHVLHQNPVAVNEDVIKEEPNKSTIEGGHVSPDASPIDQQTHSQETQKEQTKPEINDQQQQNNKSQQGIPVYLDLILQRIQGLHMYIKEYCAYPFDIGMFFLIGFMLKLLSFALFNNQPKYVYNKPDLGDLLELRDLKSRELMGQIMKLGKMSSNPENTEENHNLDGRMVEDLSKIQESIRRIAASNQKFQDSIVDSHFGFFQLLNTNLDSE